MRWFVVAWTLVACGRGNFEPLLDGGPGDGNGDGDALDDAPPDAAPRANRVFVTSASYLATLGGLVGADASCAAAASASALPGTFVAFLSTSSVDAVDRLAGSRGWVRVDGAPVGDTITSMLTGRQFNPIDLDESGNRLPNPEIWTGTGTDGRVLPGQTCSDWTSGAAGGRIGYGHYGPPLATTFALFGCSQPYHLYCFEIGHDTPVVPMQRAGRVAFVSRPRMAAGLAALDALCQQDATAASLPGTYRAAVATTSSTIASRFSGTDWQRPDGTPVSVAGNSLFDSIDPPSFVHQRADGTYLIDPNVFTGADGPTTVGTTALTCNDWNDVTSAPMTAGGGRSSLLHNGYLWAQQPLACSQAAPAICLQQ